MMLRKRSWRSLTPDGRQDVVIAPPNLRLQRTRQLTRFRRQNERTLDHWETRRYRCSRRNERYASTASCSLGEHRFQVLQDEVFVGLAVRRNPTIKAGALTLLSPDSGSERRRTGCPLNRVNILRSAPLRSPLSRKSLGIDGSGGLFLFGPARSSKQRGRPGGRVWPAGFSQTGGGVH